MNPLDRLAAAKLWLISDAPTSGPEPGPGAPAVMPYLAHALYALTPVLTPEVARMTCDEHWRVYVNADWLESSPVREIAAELAHVTWHLLLDHAERARTVNVDASTAAPWHRAADATVAHTVTPEGLIPPGLATATELSLPEGRSAEEYFAILSRLPTTPSDGTSTPLPAGAGCGSGADGVRREHELPPDADASGLDSVEAGQVRRRVAIEYRNHVTDIGTTPGDALRWAKAVLEPTIAWEPLLAGAVRRAVGWTNGHTDYTYTRPSRRQGAVRSFVLPGTRRPLPSVAMVVDTSGSVDDQLLGRALGEVDGALAALGVRDSSVTVLACDAAVHTVTKVRRARDTTVAGGGGTDMRVGITTAAALRPRPDLIVVFTDGYTPWPHQPPPATTVIAAMLGRSSAQLPPTPAWAARVECLLE
ncbi:MAG TPA: VWA-like domain-containing protein [Nocardioides sp.]|jgi:predicted metal-dependent peptidase|nr:VWA-like domain-containing protein [Nocardioides sp.]